MELFRCDGQKCSQQCIIQVHRFNGIRQWFGWWIKLLIVQWSLCREEIEVGPRRTLSCHIWWWIWKRKKLASVQVHCWGIWQLHLPYENFKWECEFVWSLIKWNIGTYAACFHLQDIHIPHKNQILVNMKYFYFLIIGQNIRRVEWISLIFPVLPLHF